MMKLDLASAQDWAKKGAQPTETVAYLMKNCKEDGTLDYKKKETVKLSKKHRQKLQLRLKQKLKPKKKLRQLLRQQQMLLQKKLRQKLNSKRYIKIPDVITSGIFLFKRNIIEISNKIVYNKKADENMLENIYR